MSGLINLKIFASGTIIYENTASLVTIPGQDGEFGVLPLHIKMIASLAPGIVKIDRPNSAQVRYYIDSGIAQVNSSELIILTEYAAAMKDMSVGYIEEKIKSLESNQNDQAFVLKQLERYRNISTYL